MILSTYVRGLFSASGGTTNSTSSCSYSYSDESSPLKFQPYRPISDVDKPDPNDNDNDNSTFSAAVASAMVEEKSTPDTEIIYMYVRLLL
jgi:hypothetical protein